LIHDAVEGTLDDRLPEGERELPGQDEKLRAGDPDVSALEAGHVGESAPGGSTPTPDQGDVDATGRAYGVEDVNGKALHTSSELLDARDARRAPEPGAEEDVEMLKPKGEQER
jgi:hypothetical protein